MRRKSARLLRTGVALATWAVAASGALALGIGAGPSRQLEQRIEEQLRAPSVPPPPAPKETHEAPSIEPWELVSV
jgi:hypothetical protein